MQYRKLLIPVFSVCLAACTAELQEVTPALPDGAGLVSEKICNTSSDAKEGMLIVEFNDKAVAALESRSRCGPR